MKKRSLVMALILALVFNMMPIQAFATESGGQTLDEKPMLTGSVSDSDSLPDWVTSAGLTEESVSWNDATNTLSFLEDVTLQQEMSIPTEAGEIVVDLNGCHVTGEERVFWIEGAVVTFKDSSGTDGKVTAGEQAIFVYYGTANIYGGTYEGMDVLYVSWGATSNV